MYCQICSLNSGWPLHLLEHGHVGLDVAHHAGIGRVRDAVRQRAAPKAVAPLVEARRRGGKRRERDRASRAPAPRPRSQQRATGRWLAGNQAVSSPQSTAGRGAAKVAAPSDLTFLLQVCGNFGQPAPDRDLRLGAEPATSRRSSAVACRRHLSSRVPPRRVRLHCNTRPSTGCSVFRMAPPRSRLRMMTPTVCGVAAPPGQLGAGQAWIGPQHRQHDELRRRDAEVGQRPFQGQPRCGLGLAQEIGDVALFAAFAVAGRRRADADDFRVLGRVFISNDFFRGGWFRFLGVFRLCDFRVCVF